MKYYVNYICFQVKYKEDGMKEMSINLYSLLPETIETQHVKEVSNLQSEVFKQDSSSVESIVYTHKSAM